jgi:hypothetical protein
MKKIFVVIFFCFLSNVTSSKEVVPTVGIWDYKHDTDAYAVNFKFISDNENSNDVKIKYLGNLKRTYDLMFFMDINNGFKDIDISSSRWTKELGVYAATGLAKNVNLGNKFIFVPSFSIGLYQDFKDGKEMGFPIEFKTELGFNYTIFKNSNIGLAWSHISNANLGNKNPGSDNLFIRFKVKENF